MFNNYKILKQNLAGINDLSTKKKIKESSISRHFKSIESNKIFS